MELSQKGLDFIKGMEDLRLTAYRPLPNDKWTIGYGHTGRDVRPGMTITQQQADDFLNGDVAWAVNTVNQCVTVKLDDDQFTALVSLCFNIGAPAFLKSTLVKLLNKGDYIGAQDQFHVWRKSGGKVVQGLVNRRAKEAALFGSSSPAVSSVVDVKPERPPVVTKENISWAATLFSGGLAQVFEGNGPVQIALAVVIIATLGYGLWCFAHRRIKAG